MSDLLGSAVRGAPPPAGDEVDEFDEFVAATPSDGERFRAARAAFRKYFQAGADAPKLARLIEQHLDQGEPASVIRLHDGEGNLLGLDLDSYPALAAYCARKASIRHFGAPEVLPNAAAELLEPFRAAIRNADVVGIPGPGALAALLKKPRSQIDVRGAYGISAVFTYLDRFRDELRLAEKSGASFSLHRDLLPHYQSLIDGRDIGLVSGHHELVDALRHRMGARSVSFYPVPKQAKISDEKEVNTGHVPDRYRELVEELRAVPAGRLYLVGAGMPGKIYCDQIRSAGGIAIDIGSVADIWAGVRSRVIFTQETIDTWRIVP